MPTNHDRPDVQLAEDDKVASSLTIASATDSDLVTTPIIPAAGLTSSAAKLSSLTRVLAIDQV